MKKFLEKHAGGLMISFCSAVLIIIGLSGWICLDFVGDDRREELYRTEADSAAYRLMDSLDEGDNILAYHYAQLVRDNAAKSGQRNTAEIFAGLSESIRITGITDAVKQAVTDYLENGEDPPEEKTEISALPDVPDEPEDVAVLRRCLRIPRSASGCHGGSRRDHGHLGTSDNGSPVPGRRISVYLPQCLCGY